MRQGDMSHDTRGMQLAGSRLWQVLWDKMAQFLQQINCKENKNEGRQTYRLKETRDKSIACHNYLVPDPNKLLKK